MANESRVFRLPAGMSSGSFLHTLVRPVYARTEETLKSIPSQTEPLLSKRTI